MYIFFFSLLLIFVGIEASNTSWMAHTVIACTVIVCSFLIYHKLVQLGKEQKKLKELIEKLTDYSNDNDLT